MYNMVHRHILLPLGMCVAPPGLHKTPEAAPIFSVYCSDLAELAAIFDFNYNTMTEVRPAHSTM